MSEGQLNDNFLVVGIGGSAGALQALETFFGNVPDNSGLAYVVVQHLSPDYKSLMVELLSRHTKLPVNQVTDGVKVEPNSVYLIPPGYNMTFADYHLHLTDRPPKLTLNLPIDFLFNSLAESLNEKAIAIILSGTGSDGTRGIRRIKEHGGTIFVQDPESASFDGMPRNALATNLVDFILAPAEMPQKLMDFVNHPFLAQNKGLNIQQNQDEDALEKIFAVLRQHGGVDFTYYKQSTMIRRIERRMSINQITRMYDYLVFLYQSPLEVQTLFKDLLIGVTQFFREPEAYEVLNSIVIPELLENLSVDSQLRMWIAGCSTGEEAYSIAIVVREHMRRLNQYPDVKIFATDIDKDALDFAARGNYPESIAADIPPKRLQDYFIKRGNRFEISRQIRDMVIFARQDLTKDPPFSRIDLISCRNVLIYLQPVLQKRILGNFEFSLNGNGYLMLGSSETTGDGFETLVSVDHKWKVFQYKGLKGRMSPPALTRLGLRTVGRGALIPSHGHGSAGVPRTPDAFLRRMLDVLATPCLVIDMNQNLLHSFGEVKQFLSAPSGFGISLDVLKMVPQELSVAIATASHKTIKEDIEVLYENVSFSSQGKTYTVHLRTVPFQLEGELTDSVLILLEPVREKEARENHDEAVFDLSATSNQRIRDLEVELQHTRENMQALVEELETSNEELQATNEELLAANEELQSTNEELQAVNEELLTVNGEYQTKIRELVELNDDMDNLFRNTSVGTLFLDNRLLVRKFTPLAQTEFNLLEQDIGRAFYHLTHNFERLDIGELARKVLDTLETLEFEARSSRNLWYLFKIMPFRTSNNSVNGVILTMVDITKVQQRAQKSAGLDRDTVLPGLASDCLVFLEDWQIVMANNAVSQLLQMPDTVFPVGKPFAEILHEDFRETCQALCRTSSGDDSIVLALKSVADDKPVWVEARLESSQLRKMKLEVVTFRPFKAESAAPGHIRPQILLVGENDSQLRYLSEGMLPATVPGSSIKVNNLEQHESDAGTFEFEWGDVGALDLIIVGDVAAPTQAALFRQLDEDPRLQTVPFLYVQSENQAGKAPNVDRNLLQGNLNLRDFGAQVRGLLP